MRILFIVRKIKKFESDKVAAGEKFRATCKPIRRWPKMTADKFPHALSRAFCMEKTALRSRVKYFSSLEEKFYISTWMCNMFYSFTHLSV